jgi:hypothetical protein
MKMVFTVVTLKGEQYTSEPIDNIDNWNTGVEHAVTYARKMSKNFKTQSRFTLFKG